MMRRLLIPVLLLVITACSREEPVAALEVSSAPVTEWRVLITLPSATLPVALHLAPDGGEAWLSNGRERVPVPDIRHEGKTWTLHFTTFNNTLVLEEDGDGFSGSLTLVKRGYEQVMDLVAEPDPGYRFTDNASPADDLTGRWEVTFMEDDGTESFAVGEFDQQGGLITGTFLTALGDYRYLAGEVDGRVMRLSTFDGAHAFVFQATVQEDGTLAGDFWSGTQWHESWVAKRNFNARLPDANQLTYLKDGFEKLEFSFPGLDGTTVSMDDEKFQGKVVLVNLAGTWCPNCGDEAEFLSGVYRQHHERGLEMVTLLYEHFTDFETAARLGSAFRNKYDIRSDLLVAGSSDKALAAETLPMLNHVLAFPTLIFIDKSGEVRRIHTGFSGPGTGQHFDDFKIDFFPFLEGLLQDVNEEEP